MYLTLRVCYDSGQFREILFICISCLMYIDALSSLEIYVRWWFSTLTYGLSHRSIYTFSRLPLRTAITFDINLTQIRQGTFSDVVFNVTYALHAYSVDGR